MSRSRPDRREYAEYYDGYVSKVPEGDIVGILRSSLRTTLEFLRAVPDGKVDHRYAPGKWSLKEVAGHVVDTEWIFTYRALTFARTEGAVLPSMDQDEFMTKDPFAKRSFASVVDEFERLRSANTILFDSFDDAALLRTGTASGRLFTVRAILYVIAGHEAHHLAVIRERYLA